MINNSPTHVAIVPDGNRRWAKLHGLPAFEGHRRGAEAMHRVFEHLIARKINSLTVWGFSIDNWKRSHDEVTTIFELTQEWIKKETPWLNSQGVRLRHIGRLLELPNYLQLAINQAVELTQNNTGMTLTLAFNYGGRAEIVDAVRRLVDTILNYNTLGEDDFVRTESAECCIDESSITRYLYTDDMPDVDLVIRTAGEFRLSNFLLWQTAYSELYFTEVLWPDFSTVELDMALQEYSRRKRRFGGD